MPKPEGRPKPGERWTERKEIKGEKRVLTYEGRKPFGRGKKLDRVIVKNEPAKK